MFCFRLIWLFLAKNVRHIKIILYFRGLLENDSNQSTKNIKLTMSAATIATVSGANLK